MELKKWFLKGIQLKNHYILKEDNIKWLNDIKDNIKLFSSW